MIAIRYAWTDAAKSEERARLMDAHKAYLRQSDLRVLLSGPFHAAGEGPSAGAMLVAEVADLAAFQDFSEGDPFVRHGVYARVELLEWRPTFGALLEATGPTG